MKKLINITLGFSLLFLLTACEDVIEVDVPTAESKIVVEAWLDNTNPEQNIRISRTQPYFQNEASVGVTGAEVTLESDAGNSFQFVDQGNGNYQLASPTPIGTVGDQFELTILVEGKTIKGNAGMNPTPVIDSITYELRDDSFFDGVFCNFFSRDIPGVGNTYWIKTYRNDTLLHKPTEINIAFDAGPSPGAEVDGLIFIPPIRDAMNPLDDDFSFVPWEVGDKARVEIHSLNLESWFIMERIRDQLLNSFNTIFAEPVVNTPTNLRNETDDEDVLGVFNVATISSLEIEIE